MAYTYKKLTDVEVVESATTPYLLIEDRGDIKKIAASNLTSPQVKSDWNEEDANSPAFILNKPESLGEGGGARVITYTLSSGLFLDGSAVTAQQVMEEWNNGSILRVEQLHSGTFGTSQFGSVVSITYNVMSASVSAQVFYTQGSGISSYTVY